MPPQVGREAELEHLLFEGAGQSSPSRIFVSSEPFPPGNSRTPAGSLISDPSASTLSGNPAISYCCFSLRSKQAGEAAINPESADSAFRFGSLDPR
jgi:hypothetical protein